jgi:hypothetical protein
VRTRERSLTKDGLILAVTLLVALVNALPALPGHLREILSVPILVLPGWAVCRAIFPGESLQLRERLAVSGGLSIAIIVLLGLCLNALPQGFNRDAWTWSLIAVTLAASGVTVIMERSSPLPPLSGVRRRLASSTVIGGIVALALMAGGLVLARQSAVTHDKKTTFTEIWMLPGSGRHGVSFGITNREGHVQRYAFTARLAGGPRPFFRSGSFNLAPGQSRKGTLSLHRPGTVVLDLFKAGTPAPYRSTRLSVR